ncbi:MAG TPA: class I SAM-dependent methyltransferase [Micromonosporaceae bacterium]|jgi:SAM-dependent methyltransferase
MEELTAQRRRERALSFGPAAALYDATRPSYPREAVDWALAPLGSGPSRVADIGAGTGIMTRVLLEAGHHVLAVEPDPLMRERLVRSTPGVTAVEGSAEAVPLPDASLDAAVAAQSYHWFDKQRAHAELARVIRPGGVFAAIWNIRDASEPWVAQYTRIVEGDRGHIDQDHGVYDHGGFAYGPRFSEVERATFRHSSQHTPESLVRLLQSRSYYLRAAPEQQRELEREVVSLTRTHPDLAGRASFELRYATEVYRAIRRS